MVALAVAAAVPMLAFGRTGGNIRPERVTIARTGAVAVGGRPTTTVSQATLRMLERTVRHERFGTLPRRRICSTSLPDFAFRYVTYGGRTASVRGSCSRPFNVLYRALQQATVLR